MQSGWRRLRQPSGGAGLHPQCLTCVFKKDSWRLCGEDRRKNMRKQEDQIRGSW